MRNIAVLVGFVALLVATPVAAAPDSVSFTGRLRTASGPVNGNVSVTFSIFNAATGGTAVWTDTLPLTADQGLVFATLGRTGNALDETVFTGAGMFLEIVVQSETLSPRLPIQSTPYAIRSSGADSADLLGTLAPSDVVTGVTAGTGLMGGGSGGDVALSINTGVVQSRVTGTCAAGQSIRVIGADGTVTCETDDNTGVTAGAGISVAGTTVSLTTCPVNQILKSTGAGYSCQVDVDTNTIYMGGAGISIVGTTVALSTCPMGQILKSNGAGYACAIDDNTSFIASTGITIAGTSISVDSTIVARKDSAAGSQSFDGGTLFLDYLANSVGVGTTTPGARLDVVGTARASDFAYTAPVANRVMATPHWCVNATPGAPPAPDQNTETHSPPNNSLGPSISDIAETANSVTSWYCPIFFYVPPGATLSVTGGQIAITDGNATCRVSGELRLKGFGAGGFGTIMATVHSGVDINDFAAVPGTTTRVFPAFPAFVVGTTSVVFVHAQIGQNATGGGDCRYSGALIDYTINKP